MPHTALESFVGTDRNASRPGVQSEAGNRRFACTLLSMYSLSNSSPDRPCEFQCEAADLAGSLIDISCLQ